MKYTTNTRLHWYTVTIMRTCFFTVSILWTTVWRNTYVAVISMSFIDQLTIAVSIMHNHCVGEYKIYNESGKTNMLFIWCLCRTEPSHNNYYTTSNGNTRKFVKTSRLVFETKYFGTSNYFGGTRQYKTKTKLNLNL